MRRELHRLAAVVLLAQAALLPAVARGGVPSGLTQQGRLFDASGSPLQSTVTLSFSLYVTPQGGVPLWTEQQTVTLDLGYFSAQLGAEVPIPTALWSGGVLYLGTTVGADAEMTPRQATQSVPYAIVAGDAVGDIHPTTVTVNGQVVIDVHGNWVGPTSGLIGPTGAQGPAGLQGQVGAQGAVLKNWISCTIDDCWMRS